MSDDTISVGLCKYPIKKIKKSENFKKINKSENFKNIKKINKSEKF
jgi:hypothetical protein